MTYFCLALGMSNHGVFKQCEYHIIMIAPILQSLDPLFKLVGVFFSLPWLAWDKISETIRTTVSLNGYTAINPDGVLQEKEVSKDDKDDAEEEGESKEDNRGQTT